MNKRTLFSTALLALLIVFSSCKKEVIRPNANTETSESWTAKNTGIYFTRCPNVKHQNLGGSITRVMGKAGQGVSTIIMAINASSNDAPTPLTGIIVLDNRQTTPDGSMVYFDSPEGLLQFEEIDGVSPVGFTYDVYMEAHNDLGQVIETRQCQIKVESPDQTAPKAKKITFTENTDGTVSVNAIVHPKSTVFVNWNENSEVLFKYNSEEANGILVPGHEYVLKFKGYRPNGNLEFENSSLPAHAFNRTFTFGQDSKKVKEESDLVPDYFFVDPKTPNWQCEDNCLDHVDDEGNPRSGYSGNTTHLRTINKKLLTSTLSTRGKLLNNENIRLRFKRFQKAQIEQSKLIHHVEITVKSPVDPNMQETFIRYAWDLDGDGASIYPVSIAELEAGNWDFDGDGLFDHNSQETIQISVTPENEVYEDIFMSQQNTMFVGLKYVDNNGGLLGASDYEIVVEGLVGI